MFFAIAKSTIRNPKRIKRFCTHIPKFERSSRNSA